MDLSRRSLLKGLGGAWLAWSLNWRGIVTEIETATPVAFLDQQLHYTPEAVFIVTRVSSGPSKKNESPFWREIN